MLTRGFTVEGALPGKLRRPDRFYGLGLVARSIPHKVYELEEQAAHSCLCEYTTLLST